MEASGINVEFLSINSKAFDVSHLMLGLGEKIIMSAPLLANDVKWFSDNDKVLSIDATDNSAKIKADLIGSSTILIQDQNFTILKKIVIDVISEQAVKLGMEAGSPILK